MSGMDEGDLRAVVGWTRRSLPPDYCRVIESLVEDARRDPAVSGLLLTGSIARQDALPGTDIDVRYFGRSERPPSFDRGFRDELLVERTFTDERSALATLSEKSMHVYAYLDGRILYDADGAVLRLQAEADRVFRDYRAPEQVKIEIADDLRHVEDKMRVGVEAGDLLRAVYCLSTASWRLIEGLWAANDLPVPPNSSVRPHLRDLQGPEDVRSLFGLLFVGEPQERAEAGLFLVSWVRRRLLTT